MDSYYSGKKEVPFSGSSYNVYCDESCHLEHDKSKAMSLGAIWCPKNKVREMSKRLVEVKGKHGIPKDAEVKWTKISPCNLPLYIDIIDYFFDDDDLSFRGLIVPDKIKREAAKKGHKCRKRVLGASRGFLRTHGG